jgi:hypothetical protein
MKRLLTGALILLAAGGAFALPGGDNPFGLSAETVLAAVPGAADKTPDQLTIGERLAIAETLSVARQKTAYVRRAAGASFMLPGAGQLMTGDYGAGALHLGAQAAIIGGAAAAVWYLAPSSLLDMSLTHDQRRDLMHSYFAPDKIGEILPVMGVAAGAMVLGLANRALAASGAARAAEAKIADGSVSFTPQLMMAGGRFGVGMRFMMGR